MKARILLLLAAIFILPHSSRAIVDLNQDGWSDLWQAQYGTGYLPDDDSDGDGRTNWQEHTEGTDPMDALSKRPEPAAANLGKGKWNFSWPTILGKWYQLEVS